MVVEDRTIERLVSDAVAGRREALSLLAPRVEGKVRAYIYRVTLNPDLTQDLCQEVLLTMVRSIGDLREPQRFWPWLYRIAQSRIQEHLRTTHRRREPDESAYREFLAQRADGRESDGLHVASQRELIRKMLAAMRHLSEQYRAVLSLRCFDQMSYGDIGAALGYSEVQARVQFYRAKEALRKQLGRQGVGKGMFLICLGLFGKVTSPAEAAGTALPVAAASVKVGLPVVLLSHLSAKSFLISLAAVALIVGALSAASALRHSPLPSRGTIQSMHFTTQLRYSEPGDPTSLSKGAYEQWFYYPEGVDGPAFFRMQRWNAWQTQRLCAWLQNGRANYYFESGERKLYITNDRVCWSSLNVRRLPTDSAEFTAFLDRVEGGSGIVHERDRRTGLLIGTIDDRFVDVPDFRTEYQYNSVDPNAFEPFWPAETPIIDQRDAMHKRGWTYFQVEGAVAGRRVTGRGCLPFVYDASREHPPWLTLRVGDDLEILDGQQAALLRSTDGHVLAAYPARSFFAGLGRPWMGLHTLDTIRRDAAEKCVRFKTQIADERKIATVTLSEPADLRLVDLVYAVNMETDLIDRISFFVDKAPAGALSFSYRQEIEDTEETFTPPEGPGKRSTDLSPGPGVPWLISLAVGELGS